jgi:hypothetical protein
MGINKNQYFIIGIGILIIFTFLPASFMQIANALTGDYSKVTGGQLTITDWNNLDDDFVAKSGSTMTGTLNMGNNRITNLGNPTVDSDAVSRGVMNTAISSALAAVASPMRNTSGAELRMVCGSTLVTAGNSVQYDTTTIRTDIDTSAANFTTIYFYYASLIAVGGSHYKITSANSIYNPTATSFRLYLHFDDYNNNMPSGITVATAMGWGWTINWCGIGLL